MKLVLPLLLLVSTPALAISNQGLAQKCHQAGAQKILRQAEAFGCRVSESEVHVSGVDNRWYNPSKYVWYTAPARGCDQTEITKLVQYAGGECR